MSLVRLSGVQRRRSHKDNLGTPAAARPRSQERSITFEPMTIAIERGPRDGNSLRGSLIRSASDPFSSEADDGPSAYEPGYPAILPTLPRYPVGQTHDMNCWSEPIVGQFHVRGRDYLRNKKKVVSSPYLLPARGMDVLLADDPPMNIGRNPLVLGGALRKLPTFIINLRFPWGVFVFYFEIPSRFCPFLAASQNGRARPSMEGMTPAERRLAKFFMGDEAHKNRSLKLVPFVKEGPWVAKSLVTGKPAIIGNKLPVTYTYGPPQNGIAEYLEADMDIGNSSASAKRIVSVCRRYMNLLTADVGFVIQGDSADELPEQMMGAIRIHRADPLKAPTLKK